VVAAVLRAFLRNALDYLPRKADDDCLQELRWMYERRNVEEARRDLKAWLKKWAGKYAKLCARTEEKPKSGQRLLRFHFPPL
jgi:putative transposase